MGKLPGTAWGNSSVLNAAEAEPTALCQAQSGVWEKPRHGTAQAEFRELRI